MVKEARKPKYRIELLEILTTGHYHHSSKSMSAESSKRARLPVNKVRNLVPSASELVSQHSHFFVQIRSFRTFNQIRLHSG